MSNNKEEECKEFWKEVDRELNGVLKGFMIVLDGTELLPKIIETYCQKEMNWIGRNATFNKTSLEELKKKNRELQELNHLKTQLSSAQQSELNLRNHNIK